MVKVLTSTCYTGVLKCMLPNQLFACCLISWLILQLVCNFFSSMQIIFLYLFLAATQPGVATLDVDLDSLKGNPILLRALYHGKTCSNKYEECANVFDVVPDNIEPSCFYICNWHGQDCRACCDPGDIYSAGDFDQPLGTCSPSTNVYGPALRFNISCTV